MVISGFKIFQKGDDGVIVCAIHFNEPLRVLEALEGTGH